MNKKITSFATMLAVCGTLVAAPVFAMGGTSATTTRPTVSVNFCTNLTTLSTNAALKMAQWDKTWEQKVSERTAALEKKRNEREAKLASVRAGSDTKRAESYEKIMGKATTDEQRAAVEKFKTAVESAVTVRKAAVDSAINSYKTGIDNAVNARRVALDAALAKFNAAIKAAEDKAAADCTVAGAKPYDIRLAAKAAIKTARDQFRTDRLAAPKVSDAVKTLQPIRKAAIEKAVSDFKAAVEAAKVELKSAFPLKTSTSATN